MKASGSSRFAGWWQEHRGAIVPLLITGWLLFATITILFLGITPGEPPCMIAGGISSQPMDPQAREAFCAELRDSTRVEWQASLTTLQRLTQEPWVWVIWYVIPVLVIGGFIVLADRLTRSRAQDAPAT